MSLSPLVGVNFELKIENKLPAFEMKKLLVFSPTVLVFQDTILYVSRMTSLHKQCTA